MTSKTGLNIAFGYRCGVGKDTAVDVLIEKHGGNRISFAGPLYEIQTYAQKVCGFEQVKDRKFLQWVGTDWARTKEPGVWVRLALDLCKPGNNFISDMRFINEFKALKENGWICVKLMRDVDPGRKGTGSLTHISETELDAVPDSEWDYIIDNSGDLDEFESQLGSLVEDLTPRLVLDNHF
jgi:hypothetical protein